MEKIKTDRKKWTAVISGHTCLICGEYTKGIGNHVYHMHNITSKNYYDKYMKKQNEDKCMFCETSTRFISINRGYNTICSNIRCSNKKIEYTKLKKYGNKNYNNMDKNKQTTMERYGYDNVRKSPYCKNKIKHTKLLKYGNANYQNMEKIHNTWRKKYGKISFLTPVYSKISQKLFWHIYEQLSAQLQKHTYFAELNKEFAKRISGTMQTYFYDFVITTIKLCIEFNGDTFHANPNLYNENDTPNFFNKNLLAQDIWKKDKQKQQLLIQKGYKVLVVWESDYNNNPHAIINLCTQTIKHQQMLWRKTK